MNEPAYKNVKKPLSSKAKKGILILCITVLIGLTAGILQLSTVADSLHRIRPLDLLPVQGHFSFSQLMQPLRFFSSLHFDDYIAVLYIEGVIQDANESYNQDWLLDTIADLSKDRKNRGILLYIDSPGDGVYQSDEVYLALEDYKYKTENPVWAYMGPLAASGGYYIACAADVIYANRNTLTGSIGVISATSIDLTELLTRYGIKMTTVTAGKNKNMFNINSPLTDEHRAIMQSVADEAYDQFTQIVAESRDMPLKEVRRLADGRIYTALQAEKNGLVDYVDTYENALDNMLDCFSDGDELSIEHLRFERKKNLYDYLYKASTALAGFIRLKDAGIDTLLFESVHGISGLPENLPLPAYYYHAP
ncbi:signal peptide peptidase SppA [Treponema sp. HNW]|uniref:signal peptide peptidase SppA n=1 Tax=Treponema sp. HNW TaxID=3116654 RepID=UPI003D0E753A